ncbi:leucyl aminopeptidase [Piscinibacter sakaiensis]|uniref:Probable cytosol aminopeptidase n=1 Tax=Piscinibacter sakaiensis TaxID=1547922 RepID=A0A0K8NW19_PISS1|nr:leucyl aminopeptidase [Piscinibacter sakaiensis]GAP34581.1 cytosol aminopeptidase PepA [Piscinibacter sakaiensis]
MDFKHLLADAAGLSAVAADALLVVLGTQDPRPAGLDPAVASLLAQALADGDLQAKAGRCLYLHRPAGLKARRAVLVFAAGNPASSAKAFKAAVVAGLAALKAGGTKHLAVALAAGAPTDAHAEAVATAAADAVYLYRHTKPSAPPAPLLARCSLVCGKAEVREVQRGLQRGQAIAAGVALARELANRPGNHCTPTFLGEQARELGKAHGLSVQVLDRRAIEKLGMGSFLAVARGSDEPPRFIVARYDGAPKTQPPVVLVGKGITFDTGGISIKPAAEMDEMKFDMGGAASVLGTLRAIAELKPRLNLVVLVPTCENMPGGDAVKPGDVVTSLSGQTIEVLNTDAEGRLILCDALTYAERLKPAVVVDVATLTGACVIALGHVNSGLFSADDALAESLLAAGRGALDPCWRMPLDDEYEEGLKSHFADLANVAGRAGGAITAARFLSRFAGKFRWAHLDIAGTAWKSGAAKGATGRPVPLLTHFVLSQAR